jgi:signal transduction histidine kinase
VEVDVDPAGVIRVSDRGPGIPEAERPLVFKRFWRRPGTQLSGAGLGLAIVAETMRAHGGSVTVATRPGGGACFALQFRDAVEARGPANAGAQARTARSA